MRLRQRWLRTAFVRSASSADTSTASSASSARNTGGPLSTRVGCTWRDSQEDEAAVAAPIGFVRYRETMAQAGQALSFRPSCGKALRVSVRYGCIGAAAMSGRFEQGGVVTASNALMCGNRSDWWGFVGVTNVDGALRERAGPGLAHECDALRPLAEGGEKLLPHTARATGAHGLRAAAVIHALAPTSHYSRDSEGALRRTYEHTLHLADDLALRSLALPALACGVASFPAATGARAALDAVEQHAARRQLLLEPSAAEPPQTLEFVLQDERVYAAFADAAHARWGKG